VEDLINKIGWKKAAAILIIISLVGIVFVLSSFSNLDKTALQKKTELQKTLINSNFEETKTPSSKTYNTPFYQISYPDNFEATLYEPTGDILSNVKLKDSMSGNQIEIITFPKGPYTMEFLAGPYKLNAYTEKTLSVNSLLGNEYINTKVKVNANELVAILAKESVLIRLQLTYPGLKNSKLENQFDDVLKSLK
jgi:hypothetical protein